MKCPPTCIRYIDHEYSVTCFKIYFPINTRVEENKLNDNIPLYDRGKQRKCEPMVQCLNTNRRTNCDDVTIYSGEDVGRAFREADKRRCL